MMVVVIVVLKILILFKKTLSYSSTQRRVIFKDQHYVFVAFLFCALDRQCTFRKFEIGRTIFRGNNNGSNSNSDYSNCKSYFNHERKLYIYLSINNTQQYLFNYDSDIITSFKSFFVISVNLRNIIFLSLPYK